MTSPPGRRRAFSVLEVIIVLAIVGILASVAIPRFADAATRYRVDAAARRVVADLTLVRERAKQASSSEKVGFDVATNSYQISGMSDPDHPAQAYRVRLSEEPYYATIASADFAGQTAAVFDGFGLPVGIQGTAGTVVIQVGDEVRTIVLDGTTGELAVLDVIWKDGDPLDPGDILIGRGKLPVLGG
jgi:prepilin-type N-terminal cleavage/methylation domain-containing protein